MAAPEATAKAEVSPGGATSAGERWHGWLWPLLLCLIFGGGLWLRIRGSSNGLPYIYNVDEAAHFLSPALHMSWRYLNPHYFVNPPAFSYVLFVLLRIAYGGSSGVLDQWKVDPGGVILLARVASAVLGALACVAVAIAARRFFNRTAGILAGAVLATSFLPVFYGHFALNDSPLLLPIALTLIGVAGVLDRGGYRNYALASIGVGLSGATKYSAAVAGLSLACAILIRIREDGWRPLLICVVLVPLSFFAANPYALREHHAFVSAILYQQSTSAGDVIKHGQTGPGGISYYLGALTWGLGWIPLLASAVAAVGLVARDRRKALTLVLPVVAFLLLMNSYTRWFSRWAMPIVPYLCILAGAAGSWLISAASGFVSGRSADNRPAGRLGAMAIAASILIALTIQGMVISQRVNSVLARTDTRQELRDWMVANVPKGSRIVGEEKALPVNWFFNRSWSKPALPGFEGPVWDVSTPMHWRLKPSILARFRSQGRCLLIVSSTIRGRVERDGRRSASADYYAALDQSSRVVFEVSPFRRGQLPGFDFDRSFLYFDGAARRPGPFVQVRALNGCRGATDKGPPTPANRATPGTRIS